MNPNRRAAACATPLFVAALVLSACNSDVPTEDTALARQWLAAVEAGDESAALSLAERLSPAPAAGDVAPDPTEASFFTHNGLNPAFMVARYNHWDFQHWSHAAFFRRLARDLAGGATDPGAIVTALFHAVVEQLDEQDPAGVVVLWPYRVWQGGGGLCDRQAWVLGELSYQLDARPVIVYLRYPVTLESPHTVAQIRMGGRVFTSDPFTDLLLTDVSIASLRRDAAPARAAWPDHQEWATAFTDSQLWAPVYPQDYCVRNQRLAARLRPLLGADTPRFGESPAARVSLDATAAEDQPIALWHYPLRLLAFEASEWSVPIP